MAKTLIEIISDINQAHYDRGEAWCSPHQSWEPAEDFDLVRLAPGCPLLPGEGCRRSNAEAAEYRSKVAQIERSVVHAEGCYGSPLFSCDCIVAAVDAALGEVEQQ